MATVGIDAIFDVKGATRAARSYAFLYAAFKRSEVTASPVRDAVDCLVPFIIPYLNNISGHQVDFTASYRRILVTDWVRRQRFELAI
jgi:hypothetical protein